MLKYTKHERVFLREHPDFDEQWFQKQIVNDPSILGLGEVVLIERERSQGTVGRLDFLLADPDHDRRYWGREGQALQMVK
jgi:hypothetical protein